MGRKDNFCSMQHTPMSPAKNRVRKWWLSRINPKRDIITISPAAAEAAMMSGFRGRMLVCDIDRGAREATRIMQTPLSHAKTKGHKPQKDFPEFTLQVLGNDIRDGVLTYCKYHNMKKLEVVDVDLTATIIPCTDILRNVVETLAQYKYRKMVLLTFRNGRDCFHSVKERIAWMRKQMPKGTRIVKVMPYSSSHYDAPLKRNRGSAMCMVALKITG